MDLKSARLLKKEIGWHKAKADLIALAVNSERGRLKRRLRILEVGCGVGENLVGLIKFGECIGLDKEPLVAPYFKKKGIAFRRGLAERLPFPSNFADVVIASDILEHIEHEQAAVREAHRVLRRRGLFFVTVPAFKWLFGKHDVFFGHHRRYQLRELEKLLKGAGFEIEYVGYWNFFLFLPVSLLKLVKKWWGGAPSHDCTDHGLNHVFYLTARLENALIGKGVRFPVGTSIVCAARKT